MFTTSAIKEMQIEAPSEWLTLTVPRATGPEKLNTHKPGGNAKCAFSKMVWQFLPN
jgi:hypothetical protein